MQFKEINKAGNYHIKAYVDRCTQRRGGGSKKAGRFYQGPSPRPDHDWMITSKGAIQRN